MRRIKWFTPFVLILMTIFILTGCGELPEKPTGLDDIETEQTSEDINTIKYEKGAASNIETATNEENEKDTSEKKSKEDSQDKKSKTTKNENKSSEDFEPNKQEETSNTNQTSERKSKQKEKSKTDQRSERNTEQKSKSSNNQKSTEKDKQKTNKEDTQKEKNESTSDSNESNKPKDSKPTIEISIVISSDEVPLPRVNLEIEVGDTVFDTLIDVTKRHGIQMDYRGGKGATAYVEGIGNVYEFDRGPGSGWMFSVNGIFPNRGAGVIPLRDGDRVEWLYTENLGDDLSADLQPFR